MYISYKKRLKVQIFIFNWIKLNLGWHTMCFSLKNHTIFPWLENQITQMSNNNGINMVYHQNHEFTFPFDKY